MKLPVLRDLLVALTTFTVVGAVLLHVFVVDQLAMTVPVTEFTTRAVATGATVLDQQTGEQIEGIDLVQRRRVAPTSPPVPDIDAYVVSTSIFTPDGSVVRRERWNGVQERITGHAIPSLAASELVTTFGANGDAVEERRPLRDIAGVLLRFPRDTPAKDVARWDPVTSRVGTAHFVDQAELDGRRVLRFDQQSSSSTDALRTTSEVQLWVRPETGAVVRQIARITIQLTGGTTLLNAEFVDDPRDVRAASLQVDVQVRTGRLLSYGLPALLLIIGALALGGAVLEGKTRPLSDRWRERRTSKK